MRMKIILNCAILAICGFLFYISRSFNTIGKYTGVNTPEFWPRIVLMLIAFIAILSIISELRKHKKGISTADEDQPGAVNYAKLAMAFCLAGLYAFSMQYVGFIISTLVFQLCFLLLQGVKKVRTLAITPLILTSLVFVLFVKLMSIPLPRGVSVFRAFSQLFY